MLSCKPTIVEASWLLSDILEGEALCLVGLGLSGTGRTRTVKVEFDWLWYCHVVAF